MKDWHNWLELYCNRINEETFSDSERKDIMNAVNPKYVLRNYMAQLCIDDADKGDYKLLNELFEMLKNPYHNQPHDGSSERGHVDGQTRNSRGSKGGRAILWQRQHELVPLPIRPPRFRDGRDMGTACDNDRWSTSA